MRDSESDLITLLKDVFLFTGLEDWQIQLVASKFNLLRIKENERLFTEGDEGDYFYILLDGRVEIQRRIGKSDLETDILVSGDFFGEESLLYNRLRAATATTVEFSRLLRLDRSGFHLMVNEYPSIRQNLIRSADTHQIIRSQKFDWLNKGEVIYQIARKHEAILAVSLVGPLGFWALSVVITFLAAAEPMDSLLWIGGVFAAALLALSGLIWGVWSWIDWGNDYYIVTDQRVVWIEKVIWLYDSRDEAPLNTILSVNITTSQVGRILGYGNVIVRTYTGQITFRNVGQPYQIAAVVEEHWHRAQRRSQRAEEEALEEAIHDRLRHLETVEELDLDEGFVPPPAEPPPKKRSSFWEKYFANFLRMRFEEGSVITYRKYWPVFLGKIWLPTSISLVTFALMVYLLVVYYSGSWQLLSPGLVIGLGGGFILFFLFPWWLYQYVDWRNDIYQVTDRYILDIERRPLGTEIKKSAPLENILSLEHRRVGLFGYFLNYGNVTINVGETKFVFLHIFEPARAQQDIFNRMYQLRRQKEMAEQARDRERIADALTMYHRSAEEYRKIRESWESDQEYGNQ